ncbi:MBL fold metallo-hydrolase [Flavobacterium sp. UW10123]|uniref:MBL fold metallo-hydrolase n=1 Tax=Flavobacterium sp. UW10123 TaxID=3230800 RepID=UPI003391E51E
MKVYFYQAECGDAARISFIGNDNNEHNIFIDSGYEETYDHILHEEILSLDKKQIDLWIVSHIHDDHIGGIMNYIAAVKRGEYADVVKEWFYNPPRVYDNNIFSNKSGNVSEIKSISQGDILYDYLKGINGLRKNDITAMLALPDLFGMKISVLSPSVKKLERLRRKYSKMSKSLQRNEMEGVSEASGAKVSDYAIKLEDFNLDAWKEDDSVENGSSITVLTELNGKRVLWLADAHPTDVVKSLKEMGYSEKNKIKCEWVKVTHHGSKGNNSNALYSIIDCENYLISADAVNLHYLPTKESIARIVRNDNRDLNSHYKFYFTYDNNQLRKMFASDSEDVFKKWNFDVDYLSKEKYYDFYL